MFEVRFNDKDVFKVFVHSGKPEIDGVPYEIVHENGFFSLLIDNQPFKVRVGKYFQDEKKLSLFVNGKKVEVTIGTELELLLKKMGFESAGKAKSMELKAPMPGLIHSILVKEGDKVIKGDSLLILEAMKMENIIKAGADAFVKKIHIKEKATVDKGVVMISFG